MAQPQAEFPPDVIAAVGPGFDDALRAMQDRAFMRSQTYQAQQWRALRSGVHPWIAEFDKAYVKELGELGVPMWAHCIVRTPEQQAKEVAEGNSKLRDGPHMHGLAGDWVHGVKAWNLTKKQWALCGHVGKEICRKRGLDLEWGGDWRDPWDPAHWQVKGWRQLVKGYPFNVPPYRG